MFSFRQWLEPESIGQFESRHLRLDAGAHLLRDTIQIYHNYIEALILDMLGLSDGKSPSWCCGNISNSP